jgi:hypothetical protein
MPKARIWVMFHLQTGKLEPNESFIRIASNNCPWFCGGICGLYSYQLEIITEWAYESLRMQLRMFIFVLGPSPRSANVAILLFLGSDTRIHLSSAFPTCTQTTVGMTGRRYVYQVTARYWVSRFSDGYSRSGTKGTADLAILFEYK